MTDKKRRIKSATLSLFICLVSAAFVIVVNVCASFLPDSFKKADMTASLMFRISDDVLQALSQAEGVELVYIVCEGEEDLITDQMLTRVSEQCDGITLKRIDPVLHPDKAEEYADIPNGSFVVKSPRRSKAVSAYDLYEYEIEGFDDAGRISYLQYAQYSGYFEESAVKEFFVGERELVSAVSYVSTPIVSKAYFTTGHGESTPDETFGAMLTDSMAVSTVPWKSLPKDGNVIVVVNPQEDITEGEAFTLKEFINGGGHVVVYTSPEGPTLTNLQAVLGEAGLERVEGTVYEAEGMYSEAPMLLKPNLGEGEFTQGVAGELYVPMSHGIKEKETLPEGCKVTPILTTSGAAFARPTDSVSTAYTKEEGDVAGPFMVGANGTMGKGSVTWYGSSFLVYAAFTPDGTATYKINPQLFFNTVTYNCEVNGIGNSSSFAAGKQTVADLLDVPESEGVVWTVVLTILLPGAVLGYGAYKVRKRGRA